MKPDLIRAYHDAGKAAYAAGCSRDSFPGSHRLRSLGLMDVWQIGWDTGLFLDALTLGSHASRAAVNPYPDHPEAAAYWTQGWRMRHSLAAVTGDENSPASRFMDVSPVPISI